MNNFFFGRGSNFEHLPRVTACLSLYLAIIVGTIGGFLIYTMGNTVQRKELFEISQQETVRVSEKI